MAIVLFVLSSQCEGEGRVIFLSSYLLDSLYRSVLHALLLYHDALSVAADPLTREVVVLGGDR